MIKHSLIYLTASIFNRSISFILLPFLTKYLTPGEFGAIAILQVFISAFIGFYGVMNVNISKKYFNLSRQQFTSYLTAIFVALFLFLLVSIAVSIGYYLVGFSLYGLEASWFLAIPIIACMSMANLLNLTVIRFQERPAKYAVWELSNGALNLILSLSLIVFANMGWEGRAYGIVVPTIAYGILGILVLAKQNLLALRFYWSDVGDVAKTSVALIPHALSGVVISLIDRLFLSSMLGIEIVGIYSLGYILGTATILVTTSFLKAWQPWFFKKMAADSQNNRSQIVVYTWCYVFALVAFSFFYMFFVQAAFPYFIDERYWQAKSVIPPLVLGCMFYGGYQIFFPYLVHMKKISILAFITPVGAMVNVMLNYWWIPIYGMEGAAWATAAAYLVQMSIVATVACINIRMPWLSWFVWRVRA